VIGPDAQGIKTTIDYRVKEDGTKVRRGPTRPRNSRPRLDPAAAEALVLSRGSTNPSNLHISCSNFSDGESLS